MAQPRPTTKSVERTDPTFTLTTTQLHALLAPVLPFADKGDTLPILAGVRVHSSGEYLYATATDRYRLGVQRVKVTPPDEDTVGVPADLVFVLEGSAVRGLLAMHKTVRGGGDPALTFTVREDRVTVTGAGSFGFMDSSTSWRTVDGTYPKLASILTAAVERANAKPEEHGPPVGACFNPTYLADFQHVTPRHSREPLRLWIGSATSAMLVRVGQDFIGALMPVRYADGNGAASNGAPELDTDWVNALAAPETKPDTKAVSA
jgi:hypothetical protein